MAPTSSSPARVKVFLLFGSLLVGFLFIASIFSRDGASSLAALHSSGGGDDDTTSGLVKSDWGLTNCLGAPFLYVTLHDKTANVLKYSRDGCLLSDNVLLMDEAYKSVFDVEFRSMAIGKHKDHDALFIADASDHNSRLLIFGKCVDEKPNYGKRHFVEIVVDSKHNRGVDHTYGVCLDKEGNVYISNQHTDSVLRFRVGNLKPMELPRSLQLDGRLDYYDGTFVQFGLPKEHGRDDQGVRAIAHVHDKIWIAHEEISGVAITDVDSGLVTNIIPLDTPVGLFHDLILGVVFVSCRSKERGGIVYAIDSETFRIRHSYSHKKMRHPTGIVTYDGILYIAEQHIGAIMTFDVNTGEFIKNVVGGYNKLDRIEQLVLSPC